MFVRRRMKKDVVTISKDGTLSEAKGMMRKHGINQLPVMDADKIIGIISKRDIQAATMPLLLLDEMEEGKIRESLAITSVTKLMTKNPIVANVNDTLEDAVILMHDYKINSLPVLTDEGNLVGIISKTDILEAFIEALGVKEASQRMEVVVADEPGALAEVVNTIKQSNTNLISFMTTPHPSGKKRIVYLRVATINILPIKEALEKKGIEILDPRNSS
ncbi:MAG: CBS domain-containing protein [Deltaproteobacteria bacterium]|nr:CBS domain-containing protein [Deltaproteobacteria bacterium]